MKIRKKHLLSVLLVMALLFGIAPPQVKATTNNYTREEAVEWVYSMVDRVIDYDKNGRFSPFDFVSLYCDHLGVREIPTGFYEGYNGLITNGWQRFPARDVQPNLVIGDIIVSPYGERAAIVVQAGEADKPILIAVQYQGPVQIMEVAKYYGNGATYDIHRPDYAETPIPYTDIAPGTYYVKSEKTGLYLQILENNDTEKNYVYLDELDIDSPGQNMQISKTSEGYKIIPLCSQTRLVGTASVEMKSGSRMIIAAQRNNNSQWWRFEPYSGGFVVRNVQDTYCVLATLYVENYCYWDSYAATFNGTQAQIWNLQNCVRFDPNGGNAVTSYKMKNYNSALTLPVPSRNGYTFIGWNTKKDGTGTLYAPGKSFSANQNVTLYAQWKVSTFTVSYNANGGIGAPDNQTKTFGNSLTLSSVKPQRIDYTFQNWNTKADGSGTTYTAGADYKGEADVTLYAQWKLNDTFTVSYDANGGTGAPSAQIKTKGKALELSTTKPTKNDMTFIAWNTKANGTGTSYAPGSEYSANRSVTLYAQYKHYDIPQIERLITGEDGYPVINWERTGEVSEYQVYEYLW